MRRLHLTLALTFPVVVDVDLNEVLATPDSFWQDYVRICATAADQALLVALDAGRCIGMGHVLVEDESARLASLCVVHARRRQGIGTAIVVALQEWAHTAGATDLLSYIPDTSAASFLAETLGWTKTEEVFTTRRGLVEQKWRTSLHRPQL